MGLFLSYCMQYTWSWRPTLWKEKAHHAWGWRCKLWTFVIIEIILIFVHIVKSIQSSTFLGIKYYNKECFADFKVNPSDLIDIITMLFSKHLILLTITMILVLFKEVMGISYHGLLIILEPMMHDGSIFFVLVRMPSTRLKQGSDETGQLK